MIESRALWTCTLRRVFLRTASLHHFIFDDFGSHPSVEQKDDEGLRHISSPPTPQHQIACSHARNSGSSSHNASHLFAGSEHSCQWP